MVVRYLLRDWNNLEGNFAAEAHHIRLERAPVPQGFRAHWSRVSLLSLCPWAFVHFLAGQRELEQREKRGGHPHEMEKAALGCGSGAARCPD